ncbi:MAG: hypothetical protein E5V24_30425, partial [Mesorhizobium sp.]
MAVFAPELQQRLVVLVERLDNPGHRASVLEVLGAGVAGLRPRSSCVSSSLPRDLTPCIAPELWRALQQRLVALAEGLGEPEDGARALRGFGAGLTGLAPEPQQRLVALAEGLDQPWNRASALVALGIGVTGQAPELQQPLGVLAERL